MNILLIITRLDSIGGAQVHVSDLATQLKVRGHNVTVVGGNTGSFSELLTQRNIDWVSLPNLVRPINIIKDFVALIEIFRTIKKYKPDIVACHSSKAGLLARVASTFCVTPVVFTAHGWSFADGVPTVRRKFFRLYERLASFFCSKVIAVCEKDKTLAIEQGVVPKDKIVTIHNGVSDVGLFSHAKNCLPVRIVMVARFNEPKDHSILIRSLSGLDKNSWILTLVGDGSLKSSNEMLAADLNVENNVHFLGWKNDVTKILAESDIFVLTSNWEGFPLSILEAMCAGLPVIASNVGGVKEAVLEGETGFLVPRGDVLILREKLKLLIGNGGLREKFGRRGRDLFEANFSLENMINKTLEVYLLAISGEKK